MKKIIVIFTLLLLPLSVGASFDNNLYYGLQNNNEVKEMQEFLTEQKVYDGPITGNFFSLTLKAVKDFQKKENISPTSGFFGPLTRTKANEILSVNVEPSNQQAVQETGTTPPTPEPAKTTNDVVKSLQDQIALLLQQIQVLQAQQTTLNQIQQNTQQIVQNTTPIPELIDNIPPVVSLEKWKNTTISSFAEHDWCKNGGLLCGQIYGIEPYYSDSQPSSGIDKLELYVDGVFIKSASGINFGNLPWNATDVSLGEHSIVVKVYDKAGNVGEGKTNITISN